MKLLLESVFIAFMFSAVQSCTEIKAPTFYDEISGEDKMELTTILSNLNLTFPQQIEAMTKWSERKSEKIQKEFQEWLPYYNEKLIMLLKANEILEELSRQFHQITLIFSSSTLTVGKIQREFRRFRSTEIKKEYIDVAQAVVTEIEKIC